MSNKSTLKFLAFLGLVFVSVVIYCSIVGFPKLEKWYDFAIVVMVGLALGMVVGLDLFHRSQLSAGLLGRGLLLALAQTLAFYAGAFVVTPGVLAFTVSSSIALASGIVICFVVVALTQIRAGARLENDEELPWDPRVEQALERAREITRRESPPGFSSTERFYDSGCYSYQVEITLPGAPTVVTISILATAESQLLSNKGKFDSLLIEVEPTPPSEPRDLPGLSGLWQGLVSEFGEPKLDKSARAGGHIAYCWEPVKPPAQIRLRRWLQDRFS